MRTSASGTCRAESVGPSALNPRMGRPAASGFSLLELTLVLAILALAAGFVLLQPGVVDDRRALESQAWQVLAPLQRICDEALVTGRPWGWWAGEGQWQVLSWLDGWYGSVGELDAGTLPPALELDLPGTGSLHLEGDRVPQVVCTPEGLRTPLRLRWTDGDGRALLEIRLAADGRQEWIWPQ